MRKTATQRQGKHVKAEGKPLELITEDAIEHIKRESNRPHCCQGEVNPAVSISEHPTWILPMSLLLLLLLILLINKNF